MITSADLAAIAAAARSGQLVTPAAQAPPPELLGVAPAHAPPPLRLRAASLPALDEALAAEQEAVLSLAGAELCRRSLAQFVRRSWHIRHGAQPLVWGPHLDAICDSTQRWLEGWLGRYADPDAAAAAGLPKVPIHVQDFRWNLPPGTLKSEIIMVAAPSWLWLHEPRAAFGCISGNPNNVSRDSNAQRDLVQSAWYRELFEISWTIRDDVDAVGKWETTAGGARTSQGMNASSTGMHVDVLLIDDPDDAHKVHSDAARRDVGSQLDALGSRLNSLERSLRGLCQQRVHAQDATGAKWSHAPALVLPAEYGACTHVSTPWGDFEWRRDAGEVLHARLTPEVLAKERRRLGSAGFAAQYNQNPEPPGGNMFKRAWWRFFRLEDAPAPESGQWPRPDGCNNFPPVLLKQRRGANGAAVTRGTFAQRYEVDMVVVSVDATFGSVTDAASRVGLLAVAIRGADRFVLDDRTRRMSYPETKRAIAEIVKAWGASLVIVEKKANGAAVIADLGGEISGMVGIDPEGGKESRAAAMSPSIEAGNWYLLDGAPWLETGHDEDDDGFVPENAAFPNGKKDDRVDAESQLQAHLIDHGTDRLRVSKAYAL